LFWAHGPNWPVAGPNLRSTMFTPSLARCSRKCPNACRVPRAWRPCTSSAPTSMPRAPVPLRMRRAPAERSTSFLTRARHLSLLCSRSPSPCAQNGAPPPWPGGEACRHRVLVAPGSLASYRVCHHLPRRAPPLQLHFSGHRCHRSSHRRSACSRGRQATGRLEPSWGAQRVRMDPWSLPATFPTIDEHPPAGKRRVPTQLLQKSRAGTLASNSSFGRGRSVNL